MANENNNTKTTTMFTEEEVNKIVANAVKEALAKDAEADLRKEKIKKFLKGGLLVLLGGAAGAAGATIISNQTTASVAGYVSDASTGSTSV